jgi:hypothetical protein
MDLVSGLKFGDFLWFLALWFLALFHPSSNCGSELDSHSLCGFLDCLWDPWL